MGSEGSRRSLQTGPASPAGRRRRQVARASGTPVHQYSARERGWGRVQREGGMNIVYNLCHGGQGRGRGSKMFIVHCRARVVGLSSHETGK